MIGSKLLDEGFTSGLIGVIEIPGPYIRLFRMEVSKNLKKTTQLKQFFFLTKQLEIAKSKLKQHGKVEIVISHYHHLLQ